MTKSHSTIVVARQCLHTSHLSVEGLGRVGADSEWYSTVVSIVLLLRYIRFVRIPPCCISLMTILSFYFKRIYLFRRFKWSRFGVRWIHLIHLRSANLSRSMKGVCQERCFQWRVHYLKNWAVKVLTYHTLKKYKFTYFYIFDEFAPIGLSNDTPTNCKNLT